MLNKLKQIPVIIGYLVLGIGIIVGISFLTDYIHEYRHPLQKENYQHKMDSIGNIISGLQTRDTIFENKFNQLSAQIIKRDSVGKLDQIKTLNEIKKLKSSTNSITLAIGDSILRSKGAR